MGFWGYVSGFFGYAAKATGVAALAGALSLSSCIPAQQPISESARYDFDSHRVKSRVSPAQNQGVGVPFLGSPDPSSDANELEARASLYASAIARTGGDAGLREGARLRLRNSGSGNSRWEGDFRLENLNGKIAGEDGNPDEDFSSQSARAAASLQWKARKNFWAASAGVDGYWRDSHSGNGPDIHSAGPYLAFRLFSPAHKLGALVSAHFLSGEWDYGSLEGEEFSQQRWYLFLKKQFESGAYIGAELDIKDNDYGSNGPRDTKTEISAFAGKKRKGALRDVRLKLGNEDWEHRFSDDESHLELVAEAEFGIAGGDKGKARLTVGAELSDDIGILLQVKADF